MARDILILSIFFFFHKVLELLSLSLGPWKSYNFLFHNKVLTLKVCDILQDLN